MTDGSMLWSLPVSICHTPPSIYLVHFPILFLLSLCLSLSLSLSCSASLSVCASTFLSLSFSVFRSLFFSPHPEHLSLPELHLSYTHKDPSGCSLGLYSSDLTITCIIGNLDYQRLGQRLNPC